MAEQDLAAVEQEIEGLNNSIKVGSGHVTAYYCMDSCHDK